MFDPDSGERRNLTRVFAGADLYVFSLLLTEMILMIDVWAAGILFPGFDVWGFLGSGSFSVIVTLTSALIAFVYFSYSEKKYSLSGDFIPDKDKKSILSRVFAARRKMTPGFFLLLAAFILFSQVLASCVGVLIENLANVFGYTTTLSPAATMDYTVTPSLVVYSAFAAPAVEEFVFRGLVMRGFEPGGRCFAIIAQAVLFSLMHGDISQLFFTFIVGMALGYVAMEYSIGWAFALHIFNNFALGILISGLLSVLPVNLAVLFYLVLFGICTVVSLLSLVIYGRRIVRYISSNRAMKGAYRCFCCKWFVMLVIYEMFSTALTFARV